MSSLQHLEQHFKFSYPELYHQLYADGMLNWGTTGPDWISHHYPILRLKPPLLLFANDFELLSFREIQTQLEEFSDPGYWMQIKPAFHFIPFAQTGSGDWYCFFSGPEQSNELPIVLLPHDTGYAIYKARHLQDFIFRSMLEAVADIAEAEYSLLQNEDWQADLQCFLHTHTPYLDQQQQQIVADLYHSNATSIPLISEEKLMALWHQGTGWDYPDKTFPYQNNE